VQVPFTDIQVSVWKTRAPFIPFELAGEIVHEK